MATVNLGAIKFNWKGAYSNSTAYAVDDVVSSGGSSYVCIQAHTNQPVGNATAYWNIMSSAGTNGTDVGTTLTTQGDILYRDGSGLQRLPKGTAGQVLQMNSGATAPEYGNVSAGLLMTDTASTTTSTSLNNVDYTDIASLVFTKTPASTSSKFIVMANVMVKMQDNSGIGLRIQQNVGGGGWTDVVTHNGKTATYVNTSASTIDMRNVIAIHGIASPNSTSSTVFKVQVKADNQIELQQNSQTSTFTIMETSV